MFDHFDEIIIDWKRLYNDYNDNEQCAVDDLHRFVEKMNSLLPQLEDSFLMKNYQESIRLIQKGIMYASKLYCYQMEHVMDQIKVQLDSTTHTKELFFFQIFWDISQSLKLLQAEIRKKKQNKNTSATK